MSDGWCLGGEGRQRLGRAGWAGTGRPREGAKLGGGTVRIQVRIVEDGYGRHCEGGEGGSGPHEAEGSEGNEL